MDMEARKPVGPVFRALRESRSLTLEEVAHDIGWDPGNLSRSERGRQELTEARLYQLSSYFGIKPSAAYALAEVGLDADDNGAEIVALILRVAEMDDKTRETVGRYVAFLAGDGKTQRVEPPPVAPVKPAKDSQRKRTGKARQR